MISLRERKEFTRIMVRRTATEPKTGFTGVVLVAALAMFRPLIAMFNARITLLPPFCCWDLSVMVGTQGSHEKAAVRKGPSPYYDGRPP